MKTNNYKFLAMSLVFVAGLAMSFAIMPTEAKASLGDTIILPQGSTIRVTFNSSEAMNNNLFGLSSPTSIAFGYANSTYPGATFDAGTYASGTELIFFITNQNGTFYSGPAARNFDGIAHAYVNPIGSNMWSVAFEDVTGGFDRDFNDVVFTVTTTASAPVCTSHSTKNCSNNSVYWYDSCGTLQDLYQQCTANQVCQNAQCVNQNIACYSNSDCGVSGIVGGPFCQGNSVYQSYKTYTCNNAGTTNSSCSNSTADQLVQTCGANQICSNGTCNTQNITCRLNSDCGANGYIGGPFCQGNAVYQNYITYTCNNPGTSSSTCTSAIASQKKNDCSTNQTCADGVCSSAKLAISCYTTPNPSQVNQQISFIANATGGNGNNTYSWTGACTGVSSSTCHNTFYQTGIETATVTVTSADETAIAVCSVNINQSCTPNASERCVGQTIYWFDSCGVQGGLIRTCIEGQTCSDGNCVSEPTVIACSANTDCGANAYTGSPFCQGGNVYQDYKTYICNNAGTVSSTCSNSTAPQLKNTCAANQTCSNGTCSTQNITCTTNTDCGISAYTGSPFCQGNAIYQNYLTYTCNNPGTSSSTCSNTTASQLKNTCLTNQTCSNGSCNSQNVACSSNSDCGANYYTGSPFCQGNAIYQNYLTYTCNNAGTSNSYCSNISVSQFKNSCYGNQTCSNGFCNENNTYGNLTITKTVRNLTAGSNNFSNSVYAAPGDMLMFMITLQANGTSPVQNVFVKDTFPANLIYQDQLIVSGAVNYYNNAGNIISGINLGTITAGQTVTITYQAQVASAQNFNYGATTLTNSVFANNQTAYASIIVNRTAVYGVSSISTGLTNNIWVDSFIVPLLITLLGILMLKLGMFTGIEKWFDSKKKNSRSYRAEKELNQKIINIRRAEQI